MGIAFIVEFIKCILKITWRKVKYIYIILENIKEFKYIYWCSEYQLGQARVDYLPNKYLQLLVISIHHKSTNTFMPVMWALLNTKKEEIYKNIFLSFKTLLCLDKEFEPNKVSFTVDFEAGLENSLSEIFTKSKIHGCLFHFKQRLFKKNKKFL